MFAGFSPIEFIATPASDIPITMITGPITTGGKAFLIHPLPVNVMIPAINK